MLVIWWRVFGECMNDWYVQVRIWVSALEQRKFVGLSFRALKKWDKVTGQAKKALG